MSFIAPGHNQALLLDATEYFNNTDMSDVTIVISEEATGSAETMQVDGAAEQHSDASRDAPMQAARLQGHQILLASYSSLFKTQLARWSDNDELELTVPKGQLAVGELLIRCLYEPQPNLAGCSQQQLIHLLQLADRHDVKKAVYAASAALSNTPTDQLEWSTAMAVFNLPPGCPEIDAYKPVFATATERLVAELGDLEVDWRDCHKCQLLLNLPFAALLALLQDDNTRVASENSVAYTIQQWSDHQQARREQLQQQGRCEQPEHPSREQLQQLVEQTRIPYCTQLYIATVIPNMPAIAPCFTTAEWLYATAVGQRSAGNFYCECFVPVTRAAAGACGTCGTNISRSAESGVLWGLHTARSRHPAWQLKERPKSALNHMLLNWSVNVRSLAAMIDRAAGTDAPVGRLGSPESVWAGRCINTSLWADKTGNTFFEIAVIGHDDAACAFEAQLAAVQAAAPGGSVQVRQLICDRVVLQPHFPARFKDIVGIGKVQSGLEAERKLREKQLVQRDDCIQFTVHLRHPVM